MPASPYANTTGAAITTLSGAISANTTLSLAGFGTVQAALITATYTTSNSLLSGAYMSMGWQYGVQSQAISMRGSTNGGTGRNGVCTQNTGHCVYFANSTGSSAIGSWTATLIKDGIVFNRDVGNNDCFVTVILVGSIGIEGVSPYGEATNQHASPYDRLFDFSPNLLIGASLPVGGGATSTAECAFCIGMAGLNNGTTFVQQCSQVSATVGSLPLYGNCSMYNNKFNRILSQANNSTTVVLDMTAAFITNGVRFTYPTAIRPCYYLGLAIKLEKPDSMKIGTVAHPASGTNYIWPAPAVAPIKAQFVVEADRVTTLNSTVTIYSGSLMAMAASPGGIGETTFQLYTDSNESTSIRGVGTAFKTTGYQAAGVETGTVGFTGAGSALQVSNITLNPTAITQSQYLLIDSTPVNATENIYQENTPISTVFQGTTIITALYQGTQKIF